MKIEYRPKGVCPMKIDVEVKDGIIEDIEFYGGCDGNHKGIRNLVKGMPAELVIERFSGVTCGFRPTSCPDQLARALRIALDEEAKQ